MLVFQCVSVLVCQCASVLVCSSANMLVCSSISMLVCPSVIMLLCQCVSVVVFECSNCQYKIITLCYCFMVLVFQCDSLFFQFFSVLVNKGLLVQYCVIVKLVFSIFVLVFLVLKLDSSYFGQTIILSDILYLTQWDLFECIFCSSMGLKAVVDN